VPFTFFQGEGPAKGVSLRGDYLRREVADSLCFEGPGSKGWEATGHLKRGEKEIIPEGFLRLSQGTS